MTKKILLTILIFLIFVIVAVVWTATQKSTTTPSEKFGELKIADTTFSVELAIKASERARGLSGRENLAPDDGMLFLFDRPGRYSFWMKDMNFPLDIIWINGDTVVGFTANVLPALPSEKQPMIYQSPGLVDKVLEINAGLVSQLGLKIGDPVVFLGVK